MTNTHFLSFSWYFQIFRDVFVSLPSVTLDSRQLAIAASSAPVVKQHSGSKLCISSSWQGWLVDKEKQRSKGARKIGVTDHICSCWISVLACSIQMWGTLQWDQPPKGFSRKTKTHLSQHLQLRGTSEESILWLSHLVSRHAKKLQHGNKPSCFFATLESCAWNLTWYPMVGCFSDGNCCDGSGATPSHRPSQCWLALADTRSGSLDEFETALQSHYA